MADWTATIHYIVPSQANNAVLLLPTKDGWSLPVIEQTSTHAYLREPEVWEGLLRILGEDLRGVSKVSVLYAIDSDTFSTADGKFSSQLLVMEARDPIIFPKDALSVSKETWTEDLQLSPKTTSIRAKITKYLSVAEDSATSGLLWNRRGWFHSVLTWTEEALSRLFGDVTVKHVTPMKTSRVSRVLRMETAAHGNFYFKTTHPLAKEVEFTRWLSDAFPGEVPKVLDVNADLNAMIMEDLLKTHTVKEDVNADFFSDLFVKFGKLQLRAAKHLKDQRNHIGLPKSKIQSPKSLASKVRKILRHPEVQRRLKKEELRTLETLAPFWAEICAKLTESKIPSSVVHADMWTENFMVPLRDELPVVFLDWTQSCITHPFGVMIFLQMGMKLRGVTEAQIGSYLSLWREYEPDMRKLQELQKCSETLMLLWGASWAFELAVSKEFDSPPPGVDSVFSTKSKFLDLTVSSLKRLPTE